MKLVLVQPVLSASDDAGNMEEIRRIVGEFSPGLAADDLVLLPEHFIFTDDPGVYDEFIAEAASTAGCAVVGGSHHRRMKGAKINYGAVVSPANKKLAEYSKLRPYFNEQKHVTPGDFTGEFTINKKNVLVLVCADFWYADIILRAARTPDLILVPALSVSRKPSPGYSRSLWKHLAVSRAYEFGVFVGISDWSDGSLLPKYRTSGAAGFADPTSPDPEKFFTPVPSGGALVTDLNFGAIDDFREDRRMRGFFWK
ncbi:MAG TPA: carbon-nitrogen hydrolase family protein [Bacteroidota bacterium]|nr:carbon-nitrogen hydrolase family protein [Bacteroidota bacterium]